MKGSHKFISEPTLMIHHVREIRLRILVIIIALAIGMGVGYFYYEPLFSLIKAPFDGPLHYMSPAGSFNFVIKVSLLAGVIIALPVAIYQIIMFVQPALAKRLSRMRVYVAALSSLVLAGAGAAFAFLVIIPMALRFFHKFQVDGLIALISADDYLRFVVNVVIAFVLIFQLPLVISFIDHVKPLPPKKLLKAEKFVIVGSVLVAVVVPFALDPMVQLLIASPIIILYNLSIGIVLWQGYLRRRKQKALTPDKHTAHSVSRRVEMTIPRVASSQAISSPSAPQSSSSVRAPVSRPRASAVSSSPSPVSRQRTGRLITDIRPRHGDPSSRQRSINIAGRPMMDSNS